MSVGDAAEEAGEEDMESTFKMEEMLSVDGRHHEADACGVRLGSLYHTAWMRAHEESCARNIPGRRNRGVILRSGPRSA